MKNLLHTLITSIIAGVIAFTALVYFNNNVREVKVITSENKPVAFTKNYNDPANTATYSNAINTPPVRYKNSAAPTDFTYAAELTTPAVVHIKSTSEQTVSSNGGRQQIPDDFFDSFRDFFGDDFFGPSPRGRQYQAQPRVASGSGVIISEDGYIVTNNHVIEQSSKLEVTLHDQRTFEAEVIGTDPSTDIGLIKITEKDLPYLRLADSDNARVGEWVLAVGNPFDLASTVTAGIVSATGRNIGILGKKGGAPIESFIQTDAAVNPGNSGGALVNTNGELLGINTAIATPTGTYAGYSFAVPANIVKKVVSDLRDFGVVQRGFLGVMIRDVNSELAKELNLNVSQGVYVDSLLADGSAAAAGIKAKDVIIGVDGRTTNSFPELQESIGRKRPGDVVNISVLRNNRQLNIPVTLRNRDGNTKAVTIDTGKKGTMNKKLGIRLEKIDAETAKKLGIAGGIKVVDIESGIIKRSTDMQKGFIITHINEQPVQSIDAFERVLKKSKRGAMVEGVYPQYRGKHYYAFGLED